MKGTVVFVLFILFLMLMSFVCGIDITNNIIPRCQEDVVLVGVGDFENGRWDSYICGPAVDDFEGYYD